MENIWWITLLSVILVVGITIPIILVESRKNEIVKANSKPYKDLLELNNKYSFYQVKSNFYFNVELNSLQKFNNFSLYNYVANNIKSSAYYADIFYKIGFNIEKYSEYMSQYVGILKLTSPADFDKFSNVKFKYKSFIQREKKLYKSLCLEKPQVNITFHCQASYTSPAGRNYHEKNEKFFYKDLKHLFKNNHSANLNPNKSNKQKQHGNTSYYLKVKSENPKNSLQQKQIIQKNKNIVAITHLKYIIETINKFEKNEKLLLIISNYLKQEDINNIELFAIPKKKTSWHLKPIYNLQDIENTDEYNFDKIRYTLTASYKKYQLQKDILDSYSLEETANQPNNQENSSIETLFNTLVAQTIIDGGKLEKESFYFILSEKNRKNKLEIFKELSEIYNIEDTNSESEIIHSLYAKGLSTKEISSYIALKFFACSEYELYSDFLNKAEKITGEFINEIKQKAYIDRLLTGKPISKTTLSDIDLMSGSEFENFISDLFKKMGYTTRVTKSSGDQGIDVLASKNDYIVAIQAKCYSGIVGNHAIMEAVAGMRYYKANKCMVITNSSFTKSAQELAKANEVELWDRQVLKEKIDEIL